MANDSEPRGAAPEPKFQPAELPLFRDVAPRVRDALIARAAVRRYGPGEVLFTAGSAPRGFFVILEGEVRVLRGAGGRQHVVHVEEAGGTLGEIAMFDGGGYPATAIAAVATRCLVFTSDVIHAAITADPEVAWIFLRRFAARTRHLVERLDRLAARSVTARLAAYLLERAPAAGSPADFPLGRSQTEVAEELGTVRDVLVRSLRQLRERGVLGWAGRGRYAILDYTRLRALAEASGDDDVAGP